MNYKKGVAVAIAAAVVSFYFSKKVIFKVEEPPIQQIKPELVIEQPAQQKKIALVTPKVSDKEITCLADMAYHEARGESTKGIAAVIHVTLNRVNSPKFPKHICGVVYQKTNGSCQYAWVCESRNTSGFRRSKEYKKITMLARRITNMPDRKIHDPTKGSLYYKRINEPSEFFRRKLVPRIAIGQHRFYAET